MRRENAVEPARERHGTFVSADGVRPPGPRPYRTAEKVVKIHFSPTRS